MKKTQPSIVRLSLSSWIFPGNVKLQVLLMVIIVVMVLARVIPLEMQRVIINEAVKLGNIDLLWRYCGIYLAAVIVFSLLE